MASFVEMTACSFAEIFLPNVALMFGKTLAQFSFSLSDVLFFTVEARDQVDDVRVLTVDFSVNFYHLLSRR